MFSSFQKMGGVNPFKILVSWFLSFSVSFFTLSFLVSSSLLAATFGDPDMRGRQMHNVGDPTAPQDVATKAYVDSKVNNKSVGIRIGGIDVSPGSTSGWPMNPKNGTYLTDYSGHSGTVMMSDDIGGSAASIGLEFTYNGLMYYHSNTDSNRWLSYRVITENSSGNVGIGTTSPQAKLDVKGGVHQNGIYTYALSGDSTIGTTFSYDLVGPSSNTFLHIEAWISHCGGGCLTAFREAKMSINSYRAIQYMYDKTHYNTYDGHGNSGGTWDFTRIKTGNNGHGDTSNKFRITHQRSSHYNYGAPYRITIRSSRPLQISKL